MKKNALKKIKRRQISHTIPMEFPARGTSQVVRDFIVFRGCGDGEKPTWLPSNGSEEESERLRRRLESHLGDGETLLTKKFYRICKEKIC